MSVLPDISNDQLPAIEVKHLSGASRPNEVKHLKGMSRQSNSLKAIEEEKRLPLNAGETPVDRHLKRYTNLKIEKTLEVSVTRNGMCTDSTHERGGQGLICPRFPRHAPALSPHSLLHLMARQSGCNRKRPTHGVSRQNLDPVVRAESEQK